MSEIYEGIIFIVLGFGCLAVAIAWDGEQA